MSGALATTSKTMGEMNKILRPEAIGADLRAFQQANMKMTMTDEMSMHLNQLLYYSHFTDISNISSISVNDTLDDMLNESDDEQETNAIVDKVLDEIGIEISGKVCIFEFSYCTHGNSYIIQQLY